MNKKILHIGHISRFVLLFMAVDSLAIERFTTAGAREAALSMSVVAVPGAFSVFHNPALLTELKNSSFAISNRRPYFIPGYSESALSVVVPLNSTVLALGITQSSVASYRESGCGISIAKQLTSSLSGGLFFNTIFMNFPEAGTHKGSFQVDGGVKYSCSQKLRIGFHLSNIIHKKIETFQYNISFPLMVRGGVCYELSEKILITAEAIGKQFSGLAYLFGSEFTLIPEFSLRGGISTRPFQHSLGLGYALNLCNIDFALVHHELLGYSPVFSLIFRLKK